MQCMCGGATKFVEREKVKKGVVIAVLSYNECSCGRVTNPDLFERNHDTGLLDYVKSGPPGPHWAEHGF